MSGQQDESAAESDLKRGGADQQQLSTAGGREEIF